MAWIDDFFEQMFPVDGKRTRMEEAFLTKSRSLPEAIYKYRAVDSTGYSIKNLEDSTVWLSGPMDFNDPFDCTLTADYEKLVSAGVINNLSTESFKDPPLPPEVIEKAKQTGRPLDVLSDWIATTGKSGITEANVEKFKAAFSSAVGKQCEDLRAKLFQLLSDSVKICSFTTKPDSLLMWGHYADQHKGFCIKYGLKGYDGVKNLRLRLLFPVVYSDSILDMTEVFSKHPTNISYVQKAALTKSKDWEYENEWRLMIPGGVMRDNQAWDFLPPTAIYLGARISPENEALLLKIAEKKNLEVYKMELSTRNYVLNPRKLR